MTMKFGIIGAGIIADVRMAPAIKEARGCELVAVQARDSEKARAFAAKHDVAHWYADWRELLANQEVDAVYIATPPFLHPEQAISSAQAGKHVLLEKPMANTLVECDDIIAACVDADVRLGMCFMMRFHPVQQPSKNTGCFPQEPLDYN